jgi:DsbC/DsbD-like thiol-disulfide interchange protein
MRCTIAKTSLLTVLSAWTLAAAAWSEPVEVRLGSEKCIAYRARLDGEYLVVEATPEKGWHTFSMDNEIRAKEALAGKRSLGVDAPTQISLSNGLESGAGWYQPEPENFSKPELRWFSWGYEKPALFVTKVRRSGAGPAEIAIRGQACTETSCKNIEVALSLPLPAAGVSGAPAGVDLKSLVAVRESK